MQRFIPVVVIKELAQTDKILTALKNNNIYCAEITFRTDCAAEAIAYALRDCVEVGGMKIDKAVLCGGGAVSKVWQTVLANVLGADIYLTETEQGPSMGGALLAMTACGEYETVYEAADATVKRTLAVKCDPMLKTFYDKGYNVYRQQYPQLKIIL